MTILYTSITNTSLILEHGVPWKERKMKIKIEKSNTKQQNILKKQDKITTKWEEMLSPL